MKAGGHSTIASSIYISVYVMINRLSFLGHVLKSMGKEELVLERSIQHLKISRNRADNNCRKKYRTKKSNIYYS